MMRPSGTPLTFLDLLVGNLRPRSPTAKRNKYKRPHMGKKQLAKAAKRAAGMLRTAE